MKLRRSLQIQSVVVCYFNADNSALIHLLDNNRSSFLTEYSETHRIMKFLDVVLIIVP